MLDAFWLEISPMNQRAARVPKDSKKSNAQGLGQARQLYRPRPFVGPEKRVVLPPEAGTATKLLDSYLKQRQIASSSPMTKFHGSSTQPSPALPVLTMGRQPASLKPIQRTVIVGAQKYEGDEIGAVKQKILDRATDLYDQPFRIFKQLDDWASEWDEFSFDTWDKAIDKAAEEVDAKPRDRQAENQLLPDPEAAHAGSVSFDQELSEHTGSAEWWQQQLPEGRNKLDQIVVAGHGYRKPWENDTTLVPEGTTIHFYVIDEVPLPEGEANVVEETGIDFSNVDFEEEHGANALLNLRLRDIAAKAKAAKMTPEQFLADACNMAPENFKEAVAEKITEDFKHETGLTQEEFLRSAKGEEIRKPDETYLVHPKIIEILKTQGKSLTDLKPSEKALQESNITADQWNLKFNRTYKSKEPVYNYTITPSKEDDTVKGTPVRLAAKVKRKKLSEFLKPNLGELHLAICREVDWYGGFAELMSGHEIHKMPPGWQYTKATGYKPPEDWEGPRNPALKS